MVDAYIYDLIQDIRKLTKENLDLVELSRIQDSIDMDFYQIKRHLKMIYEDIAYQYMVRSEIEEPRKNYKFADESSKSPKTLFHKKKPGEPNLPF